MWSRLFAVRAGISDRLHDRVQRLQACFRGGSREGGSRSLSPRSRPGVRIRPILPVTVIIALRDRALIDEGSESPALQGPVCGPGSTAGFRSLEVGLHGVSRIKFVLFL